jgi:hypothetical protein
MSNSTPTHQCDSPALEGEVEGARCSIEFSIINPLSKKA